MLYISWDGQDVSYRISIKTSWRLARNISDASAGDPGHRSPVVVIQSDALLAMIKNHGENTFYGLATSFENGPPGDARPVILDDL